MPQIDWGNMTLAFAALAGVLGWAVMFGLYVIGNSKPADKSKR